MNRAIEICYGKECLFGENKQAPYGVREWIEADPSTIQQSHWYHHYWGIRTLEDAETIVKSLKKEFT